MHFIHQKELFFYLDRDIAHSYKVTASESEHQAKILDYLEAEGFVTTKVIVANKRGGSDIWAGSSAGQLWLIEVKREDGVLDALQEAKLMRAYKNHVVIMCPYGYEDFKRKYKRLIASS